MKLSSHSWKQHGAISLWRYTENECNYPGWHLSANPAGCESLIALIEALAADGANAARSVELMPPTSAILSVPNNKHGTAKFVAPTKLRISFSGTPDHWLLPQQLEPAELSFGHAWLAPLRNGLAGIPNGIGDFSIGGDLPLWFWWQADTA